jgi:pimeloyl-ACP methyl ester carboxylesterase
VAKADRAFAVPVPGGELGGIRSGQGLPLLVLHGGPGLTDYSDWFASELDGWTALRYTQRGVAPSTTAGPFTVDQHVADALAVLDHHQVGAAAVLGHSWGGYLAMHLAATAPARVAGLVLVDTLGGVGDGGFAPFAAELAARAGPEVLAEVAALDEIAAANSGTAEATTAVVRSLGLMWPAYFADPPTAPPMPGDLRLGRGCYAETFTSIGAAQADGSLGARLASYRGPVEVVAGDASPFPVEVAESTGGLFADGHVTVEPGAGHFVWYERPGCVAAALGRLAARISIRLEAPLP